ncbi:DoxX family membrane protein [Haloprofundus halophilus]|uniref:DoxX family membrane protein n=1 Tax=Haloprofundus halophilus TaxID=2283527 RepID=UPI000E44A789|nr:DoxX family membrane protein [Haloprofundus halophilus]
MSLLELHSHDEATTESGDERPERASSATATEKPFLLGRLLFGATLGFMAATNFQSLDETVQYAESKGVPNAEKLVPFASGMAVFGGIGIALWRLPALAAGAAAAFLAGVTPTMHDFWTLDEDEGRQDQQIQFMKNLALFGAAIGYLVRALRG